MTLASPLSSAAQGVCLALLLLGDPQPRPAGPPSRLTAPSGTCPWSQGGRCSPLADVVEADPCPPRQPPTTPLFSRIDQLHVCKEVTFPVTFHRGGPATPADRSHVLTVPGGPRAR